MHTAQHARRRGIGQTMLDHLVRDAQRCGFGQLSLETGTMDAFAPARALYAKAGFVPCGPFAEYASSPNSCYMTLELRSRGP
jgi:putative acetyltransferase